MSDETVLELIAELELTETLMDGHALVPGLEFTNGFEIAALKKAPLLSRAALVDLKAIESPVFTTVVIPMFERALKHRILTHCLRVVFILFAE